VVAEQAEVPAIVDPQRLAHEEAGVGQRTRHRGDGGPMPSRSVADHDRLVDARVGDEELRDGRRPVRWHVDAGACVHDEALVGEAEHDEVAVGVGVEAEQVRDDAEQVGATTRAQLGC
jgi:hypothetical protein